MMTVPTTAVAEKLTDENYLIEEFEKHKGQFVITPEFTVERLIAILKSEGLGRDEYYYLTFNGRQAKVHPIMPGKIFISLERLDRNKYKRLTAMAKVSHFDQPGLFGTSKKNRQASGAMEQYNKKVKQDVLKACAGLRMMTEICWQIN